MNTEGFQVEVSITVTVQHVLVSLLLNTVVGTCPSNTHLHQFQLVLTIVARLASITPIVYRIGLEIFTEGNFRGFAI